MAIRAEKVERTILRRDGDDLIEHLREAERIETYERARLSALGHRCTGTEVHANRERVKVTIRFRRAARGGLMAGTGADYSRVRQTNKRISEAILIARGVEMEAVDEAIASVPGDDLASMIFDPPMLYARKQEANRAAAAALRAFRDFKRIVDEASVGPPVGR